MASQDVEFDAIADTGGKFARLAKLLGLADADHALGRMAHLWMACTTRGETDLPQWLVEHVLGDRGPDALVEVELARWARGRGDSKTRRMYICGAKKHCTWLRRNQEQSPKGGKARVENSSRVAGRFVTDRAGEIVSPAPAPSPFPLPSLSSPEEDLGADSPDVEPAKPPAAPLTLTPEPPASPPRTAPPGRRARMPAEWSPSRTDANVNAEREASERGVDVSNELVKFRDWAVGKGEPKADWNATWRNWTRNARPQQNFGPRGSAERAPDPPRKIPTLA